MLLNKQGGVGDCGGVGNYLCVGVTVFPVICFSNGSDIVVLPMDFDVEVEGLGHVTRRQVPLHPAGACTVHKLQGWELDELMLCLRNAKHVGQVHTGVVQGKVDRNLQVLVL